MQEGCEGTPEGGDISGTGGAQDGERGGSGTNSSRRMRDNAAHPCSLICIHPVRFVFRGNHHFLHLPSTSSIFNGLLIDQQRLRGDVEMRIFRAAFRHVFLWIALVSSPHKEIYYFKIWIVRKVLQRACGKGSLRDLAIFHNCRFRFFTKILNYRKR